MSNVWFKSLMVAAFGVVVWRAVTLLQLASGRMEGFLGDPAGLVLLRGLMGLLFVACGLAVAWHELPWAKAFGWYGVTYGLHWGGPIFTGPESQAQAAVVFFYLLVSGAAAHSFLLLWLCSYPSRKPPPWIERAVLVPPGLALLAGGLGLASAWTALVATAQAILGIWPTLATILGLISLSVSAFRDPAARGRQVRLIGLLLAAFLPWEIASASGSDRLAAWLTLLFVAPAAAMVIWARREARANPVLASEPDSPLAGGPMKSGYLALVLVVSVGISGAVRGASLDDARSLIEKEQFNAALTLLEQRGRPAEEAQRQLLMTRARNGLGDWKGGVEAGERAVEMAPKSSAAHLAYAIALSNKMESVGQMRAMMTVGDYKEALAKARDLDPDSIDARVEEIGYLFYAPGIAGGSKSKAEEKIREMRALDARQADLLLGDLKRGEGEIDTAVELYRRVFEISPNDSDAYESLGFAFQIDERWAEADEAFGQLVGGNSSERQRLIALYQLGRSRVLGEYDAPAAVEYFDRFIEELSEQGLEGVPSKADGFWRRGLALEQIGEASSARQSYQRALSLDPEHEGSKKALNRLR